MASLIYVWNTQLLSTRVPVPASLSADILWNSGSCNHFHILLNVSRPDFSFDHGFGFLKRSLSVPCDLQRTLCANIACGIEYLFNSPLILCANSFVFISSVSVWACCCCSSLARRAALRSKPGLGRGGVGDRLSNEFGDTLRLLYADCGDRGSL